MANLVVRNVDERIVEALKVRARKRGTSAEDEHRRILVQALRSQNIKSFARALSEIPNVGVNSDFERLDG